MLRLGFEDRWTCWLCGMLLSILPAMTVRAQPAAPAEAVGGTQTLVFLRADHPIFVQLTVKIDGLELREIRTQRVTQTWAELDANRDGLIDQAERDKAPKALRKLGVRDKWPELLPKLDTNPQDGKVSEDELKAFAAQLFGPPVVLAARTRSVKRSSQAVELFDLLDENQDQILSESEFGTISSRLNKLDADGDDAFSVIEVEPFRNPFGPRLRTTAATPEDSPWALVETAAETLLKRFDSQPSKGKLNANELGLPKELVAQGDSDHDDQLSPDELTKWLPTVPPTFCVNVTLPQRKLILPGVTWTDASTPPPPPLKPGQRPKPPPRPVKNIETLLAGQPLQLQVTASRTSQNDNLAFYRNQFRRSDADKNKYLSATEFAAMKLPGATFELVDSDGNGEVHDNELQEFLELENLVDQGHVLVTYDSNELSLFALLDLNKDNRLTPRECLHATEAWQANDINKDHQLARHELSGKLRLTVELVKPRLFQDAAMAANNMTGEPVINERSTGPLWFRGMDRNQDGDISRREFLGTDEVFKKWDKDSDGLISVQEAEQT